MKIKILFLLLWVTTIFFSAHVSAQSKEKFYAQVIVDAAIVFSGPSFNAKTSGYIRKGEIVQVSEAQSDFVYVRTRSGTKGYLRYEDLIPLTKDEVVAKLKKMKAAGSEGIDSDSLEDESDQGLSSVRFIGGGLTLLNYEEVLLGSRYQEQMSALNFKMSGPGILGKGNPMPLDINFRLQLAPPQRYRSVTGQATSGFLMHFDMRFLLPLQERKSSLFYAAFGPMLVTDFYNLKILSIPVQSQTLRLGISTSVGAAIRYDKYALRFEGSYYFERDKYFGLTLALQRAF